MPSSSRAADSPHETRENQRTDDGVVVRKIPQPNALTAGLALTWILAAVVPAVGFAQSASVDLPENSYSTGTRYGRAWECDHGYRETADTCVRVEVPQHAFLNAMGDTWKCERGYRKADDGCLPLETPANSYLTMVGDTWTCDRGYRPAEQSCVAITVPVNGYATNSGHGSGWTCDRGYRAVGQSCVVVEVPTNGYLVDSEYGAGWECNRGYRRVSAGCVALQVPQHGHLDYSGNDWECDRPYLKRRENYPRSASPDSELSSANRSSRTSSRAADPLLGSPRSLATREAAYRTRS